MKKIYNNPAMKVVEMKRPNLCAISDSSATIYDTTKSASSALGRKGGFLDEEEEDY